MLFVGSEPMECRLFLLLLASLSIWPSLPPRPRRRQLCAASVGGECWAGGNQRDVRARKSRRKKTSFPTCCLSCKPDQRAAKDDMEKRKSEWMAKLDPQSSGVLSQRGRLLLSILRHIGMPWATTIKWLPKDRCSSSLSMQMFLLSNNGQKVLLP